MKKLLSIAVVILIIISSFSISSAAVTYRDAYPNTHKNTNQNLADLIAVAKTQIGYTELSTSTGAALSAGQDGGYTKYGAWFGAPTTAWCAFFVAWCSNQAGISTSIIPRIGNCAAMVNWYSQRGRYHSSKNFTPRTGDLIFYNWSGGSTAKHIGIVTGVSSSSVYVIEGNTGSSYGYRVEAKTRKRTAAYIIGYARPDYNDAATYIGSYSFAQYAASQYAAAASGGNFSTAGSYSQGSKLSVTTGAATNITAVSATLAGRVDNSSKYTISSAGFYFGKTKSSLKAFRCVSSSSKGSISLSMDVSKNYGSLKSGEVYYYCSYAVIKGKTYKGPLHSFQTLDDRAKKLVLSQEEINVAVGNTFEIFSALLPLEARKDEIKWSSDNDEVAIVNQNGVVTGVSAGMARITAKSEYSNIAATCEVTVTLAPVLEIEAKNISQTQIKIFWKNSDPVDLFGYNVYRSSSPSGEYIKIGQTDVGEKEWLDKTVVPNERYYYKIESVGVVDEVNSELSEMARAKAVLPAPEISSIKQKGASLVISWSAIKEAEEYNVYKSKTQHGSYQLIGTVKATNFADNSVSKNEKYFYKISAVSNKTQSLFSAPIQRTVNSIISPDFDVLTMNLLIDFDNGFEKNKKQKQAKAEILPLF